MSSVRAMLAADGSARAAKEVAAVTAARRPASSAWARRPLADIQSAPAVVPPMAAVSTAVRPSAAMVPKRRSAGMRVSSLPRCGDYRPQA